MHAYALATLGWHMCPKYVACHFCIPDFSSPANLSAFNLSRDFVQGWLSRRAVSNTLLSTTAASRRRGPPIAP